jgi:hypothetical protein
METKESEHSRGELLACCHRSARRGFVQKLLRNISGPGCRSVLVDSAARAKSTDVEAGLQAEKQTFNRLVAAAFVSRGSRLSISEIARRSLCRGEPAVNPGGESATVPGGEAVVAGCSVVVCRICLRAAEVMPIGEGEPVVLPGEEPAVDPGGEPVVVPAEESSNKQIVSGCKSQLRRVSISTDGNDEGFDRSKAHTTCVAEVAFPGSWRHCCRISGGMMGIRIKYAKE